MNVVSNVVVEQVGSKPVTTRFGSKTTYSFKADGQWFKTGFKNSGLKAGDVVSFSYTEGTYGKAVDAVAITKSATAVGAAAGTPGNVGSASGSGGTPSSKPYSGSGKGVFPIPPLDGQRSIVRQNALTNARELVTALLIAAGSKAKDVTEPDRVVDMILAVARRFEAYTAGDLDAAELEAEMAAEKEAA